MTPRMRVAALALTIVLVSTASLLTARTHGQQFRGLSRIVPVDVRVTDASGRPVTDLTQDDFIVLDNGQERQITQFATETLPGAVLAGGDRGGLSAANARVTTTGRVFLIVLGRGRHTGPAKEVEAAIAFVRDQLTDADRVGVLAYNRSTPFTANRQAIEGVLERFRLRHEEIEALLVQYFSGLRAVYGSREIPADIQALIDGLFRAPGISGGPVGDIDRTTLGAELRATADDLLRASILADRPNGLPDPVASLTAENLGVSFDEFVERGHQTVGDFANLYKAVAFLRYLDGEKHLVFVTPQGMHLPRAEFEEQLGRVAADARVALHTIYTDSPAGPPPPTGRRTSVTASFQVRAAQLGMVQGLREISRISGGNAFAFQAGSAAFERIGSVTGFQYVLGYVPAIDTWNGAFRKIEVRVRRPGLTLHYRRGYNASEVAPPIDTRTFVTSYRIAAAEAASTDLSDGIRVTLDRTATIAGPAGTATVTFEVIVDPRSRLGFVEQEARQTARVDLKAFVGDEKGQVIGAMTATLELRLGAAAYEDYRRDGLRRRFDVPVKGRPAHLKVILFAYDADALGTASARIR